MKSINLKWIAISFLLFFWIARTALPSHAITDLTQLAVGGRAIGMGRAVTADPGDASAIFANPAGLNLIDQLHFTSMSTQLIGEVNYTMAGGVLPTALGNLGLGYINASTGNIPVTSLNEDGVPVLSDTATYGAATLLIAYGRSFHGLQLGATAKYLTEGFAGGSIQNGKGAGFDVDLGGRYEINDWLTLGVVGKNILPSSMGGTFQWETGKKESLSASVRAGLSLLVLGKYGMLHAKKHDRLILNIDTEMGTGSTTNPSLLRIGTEYRPGFAKNIAMRAGLDQNATSNGNGATEIATELSLGLGLNLGPLTFDYAYKKFSDLDAATSHFFSFGYRPEVDEEEDEILTTKPPITITETPKEELKALKATSFKDLDEEYWARSEIEITATLGMAKGFPDGTFRPESPVSRAELCAMLVKAKNIPLPKTVESRFSDVANSDWAAPYIAIAVGEGWIQGYGNGQIFRPNQEVSRGELVIILTRFDGLPAEKEVKQPPFPDLPVSHWVTPYVSSAQKAGWISFLTGKPFDQIKKASRAETVYMLAHTSFGQQKTASLLKRLEEAGYVLQHKKKPFSLIDNTPTVIQ